MSLIEFEAELYGYVELMRPLRAWVRRLLRLELPSGASRRGPAPPGVS